MRDNFFWGLLPGLSAARIKSLRRVPSGDETRPNQTKYDESKANRFSKLPNALTASGKSFSTPRPTFSYSIPKRAMRKIAGSRSAYRQWPR